MLNVFGHNHHLYLCPFYVPTVANTSIAAAAAFLTWLVLDAIVHKPSAVGAASGAVVGMVAITPASGYVLPG